MKIETTTTVRKNLTITKKDLVDMLYAYDTFFDIEKAKNIEIYINVPSGGDWSGMRLDIDQDAELKITFEVEDES